METNKNGKNIKMKFLIFVGTLAILVGIFFILPLIFGGAEKEAKAPAELPAQATEEAIQLKISAVGDVMVHKSQIPSQYQSDTGTYSYDNNFEYIKKYIEDADLALCNLETTFAGSPYTGYPAFSAPETLADALKNSGFDVALTANNHIMDKGISGMKKTLEISRAAGLKTAGTMLGGEKNYTIVEVKGVKIGIVAYLYETGTINGMPTINGNQVSNEALPLLNTFSYETLDEDMAKVGNSISDARGDGAEIVICYFHWGEEYQRSANDYQLQIARQAADLGADVIFASHPHVLQEMDMLTVESTGKKVPVFYSMGNCISNQRTETLDNRYTEQGIIAEVNLEYMQSKKQIQNVWMGAVPIWVDKYKDSGKNVYSIVPLDEELSMNPSLSASGHLARAQQALQDVKELLGEQNIRNYDWK